MKFKLGISLALRTWREPTAALGSRKAR